MGKKWVPLESNPDVLNEFGKALGADLSAYCFQDVYSLDEELLAMVPRPVIALIMLFCINDETEKAKEEEEAVLMASNALIPPTVYYMKQYVSNACGTIALLHAVGNNRDKLQFGEGSFVQQFFDSTADMDPEERGRYLEDPPAGAPTLEAAHEQYAAQGQTEAPSPEETPDLHFVTFVTDHGKVYELDGRKSTAVCHGRQQHGDLVRDCLPVIQQFIARSKTVNFNLIALAPPSE